MDRTYALQTRARRILAALALLSGLASIPVAGAAPPIADNDTVVVVVSAASSVTEISRLHLADLYMGRTSRFPNGSPAVPIDQRAGSPERAAFSHAFLGRSEAQMKAHWSKLIFTGRGRPPGEVPSGQALRDVLARDPSAIGYLDRAQLDPRLRIVRVQ